MKGMFVSLLFFCCFAHSVSAQSNNLRPPAIGVSFVANDFISPVRIRNSSLGTVLKNNNLAKFNQFGTGLAIHYFQGLRNHIDFAATLAGSFVKDPLPDGNSAGDNFLLEADASAQFKLVTERYWFTPYFNAGIGVSHLNSGFGAFVPLGLGLKLNLFDEAAIFLSSQYRVPVTMETNAYHFVHSFGVSGIISGKKEEENKTTF